MPGLWSSSVPENMKRFANEIDDLINSYKDRHLYFPNKYTEGNGLGFMAFNTARYKMKEYAATKNYAAIEDVYNMFVRSVELEKDKTQPNIWDSYFKLAETMTQIKKDTTIIIDAYERATDYIDVAIVNAFIKYEKTLPYFGNLDSAFTSGQIDKMEYDKRMNRLADDTARQMKLVNNYRKTLSNIEGKFLPYAPCNVLEQVYTKKFDQNKNYDAIEEVYNWFVRSVDMEKENTQPGIWDSYFTVAEIMTQMKKDTTIIIEAYERATDYIDMSIVNAFIKYEKQLPNFANLDSAFAKNQIDKMEYDKRFNQLSADTARQMKFVSNYRKTLSNIEGKFQPYAPCNVLEQVYAKKFDQNRNNIKALKKMVLTMSKGNCVTSPVFKDALELVHAAEPGAQSAYLMGNLSLRNGEIDKAIEYFNEAISLFETQEQKVDCYYMLGLAYQLDQKYSESRNAALQAIKIHPNCGKAYILIGDLYASSGNRCGGDDL